jgi:hypothetical protein
MGTDEAASSLEVKTDMSNERVLVDIRLKDFADRLNDFGSNFGKRLDDVGESLGNRLGNFGNRLDQFAIRLLSHKGVHLLYFATLLTIFGRTYKLSLDINQKIDASTKELIEKIDTISKELNEKFDTMSKEVNQKVDILSKELSKEM